MTIKSLMINDDSIDDVNEEQNDSKINLLLVEVNENRSELKKMIKDIEKVKEKIDSLFPDTFDSRKYRFVFEQKVKTATEMFRILLDVRKELSKTLKDEIELRRKIKVGSTGDDDIDIRVIAEKIEKMNKDVTTKRNKKQKELEDVLANNVKIAENTLSQTLQEGEN